MDDVTENYVPENCIILSPEELAKLGVKIENPLLSTSPENDPNIKYVKEEPVKEYMVTRTFDISPTERNTQGETDYASCNESADVLISHNGTPFQITSVNSNENKVLYTHININNDSLAEKSDASTNTKNKYCNNNEETKQNTQDNFFHNSNVTNEKMKPLNQPIADDIRPFSDSVVVQSLKQKPGRGKLKKSIPTTMNKDQVTEDVSATKSSPSDQDLNIGQDLKFEVKDNDATATPKLLIQHDTNNSHTNLENVCNNSFPLDDTNTIVEDTSNLNNPKIGIQPFTAGVPKCKRGRPRKSVPHEVIKQNKKVDQNINEYVNNTSEQLGIVSRKERKGRRKNYKVLDSDLSSNNDIHSDSDSDRTYKAMSRKRKRDNRKKKQIIDSDTSSDPFDSSDEDFKPLKRSIKIETSDTHYETKGSVDNDTNNTELENISCKSTIGLENKIPKKRGRPKKNSLEANKTVDFSNSISEHTEMDDSVVVASKRGRKRTEVNYLLLENPDFSEHEGYTKTKIGEENKVPKKRGRPKKTTEYQESSNDSIKIEIDDIQLSSQKTVKEEENNQLPSNNAVTNVSDTFANSNETNDDDSTCSTQRSSRYKWTGNVTKAINQMFNVIQDKGIDETRHDPLLGKIKRKGRWNTNADNFLDKDGSSVCMVCNEIVPNPQWSKHKRKIHYNLTWRKGDVCLDPTNGSFVLRTLTQLIGERGFIKCNRCAEKHKNARKFVSHLDTCNGIVSSSGYVTCAVCKTTIEKSSWQYHNYRQHNNLAWREGDPPLNLEDQDLVMRILNALYKAKKPLYCEKCDQQKKSVLGYLSHKTTCQKTDEEVESLKVECHLCFKRILPVSMDYHIKSHEAKPTKNIPLSSDYFDANVDIIGKRRAAKQALEVINSIKGQDSEETKYYISQCNFEDIFVIDILRKELRRHSPLKCIFVDCDFSSDVVETIAQHMNSCEKKPERHFLCKICLSCFNEESAINEHVKAEHNKLFKIHEDLEFRSEDEQNESESDELLKYEESEKKRLILKGKQKMINHTNVRVKPIFLVHPIRESPSSLLYRHAYAWMLEFCTINYNQFNLYQHHRNNKLWQVLDCDILSNYLPKNSESCDVAAKVITSKNNPDDVSELNFRKLELFQVCYLHEGDVTIFCGGPINALAWLPTPFNQKTHNQILAVAVLDSMESYYAINKNYHEPCVVQFWDFGVLSCYQENAFKPGLLFGMALTCGPIWHLEWCPSGCLDCFEDHTTCRLGLLAVAASDSYVYIYSIDNIRDVNDRGFVYKGEPVLKLILESETSKLEGQNYYPTKISWSKAATHRYIAVGYSTGLIALYDLLNESQLLKGRDKTGTNIIFPYKTFQAHYSSVKALTLSHLGGGNRWLFSASFDRTSQFWDLSTTTKITPHRRTTISDGIWMTQWPTYLVAEDESIFNERTQAHSYYRPLRYLMSPDAANFTFAISGINTLSYSDWLNTILHGSNAGEVMAQFVHRMFFGIEPKIFRSHYVRCLFSLTKLVKKDSSENCNSVATTYDEAAAKYNVAFVDYDLNNINNTPNSNAKDELKPENLSTNDVSEYNLQSINKVALNPNPQACSFYAIGYQAGFIRLQEVQFVNALLPK